MSQFAYLFVLLLNYKVKIQLNSLLILNLVDSSSVIGRQVLRCQKSCRKHLFKTFQTLHSQDMFLNNRSIFSKNIFEGIKLNGRVLLLANKTCRQFWPKNQFQRF